MPSFLPLLLLLSTADAAKPAVARFRAVDGEGKPIPSAAFMLADESTRHLVNAADGTFAYETPKGSEVWLVAVAPGYKPARWNGAVSAAQVDVALEPSPPQAITDEGIRDAGAAWVAAEQARIDAGQAATSDMQMAVFDARYEVVYRSAVWLHDTDPRDATVRAVCMSAADAPQVCVPPDPQSSASTP